MHPIMSSIVLQKLELRLPLGWPEEERYQAQRVTLDLHLHFSEPPEACRTDILDEKINYDTLTKTLTNHLTQRSFKLIEHLGHETYHFLKSFLPQQTSIIICVTKYPSIPYLHGGVSFWYGDRMS